MVSSRDWRNWPLELSRMWANVHRFLRRGFHVDRMSFAVLCAFAISLLLLVICMPLICCCRQRRRERASKRETSEPIKRRFPLTVARFEEFDALSPLIVSPTSNPSSVRQKRSESEIRESRELFLRQHIRRADDSPPPLRRFNGRTQIVPLTGSSNRLSRPLAVPLLNTPESRITSFEAITTKSCATIPEDDELEADEEETLNAGRRCYEDNGTIDDLISIDRTYISTSKDPRQRSAIPNTRPLLPAYAPSPICAPEFRLNPPNYSPPAPPIVPAHGSIPSTPVHRPIPSRHDTVGQSNLSSPEMSSCGGFGSMMETTGSVSDSYMIPMDVDVDELIERQQPMDRVYYNEEGEKMIITELDQSSGDSSQLKSLPIEEESEQFENPSCISQFLGSSSNSGLSKYNNNLLNNNPTVNGQNLRIPRSISQQLEFMNSTN
ncbi:hypothetical protein M3Y98_00593700 [Aphelenchoides besseyi]|nr:hypothetical protein M3Y98_00593700 [Aphelenchoides besseyi]KAI6194000.1 hypothetical protein M3Y96_01078600 [Aphelenchoides besseyi]